MKGLGQGVKSFKDGMKEIEKPLEDATKIDDSTTKKVDQEIKD
jgi:Sec-independent protein translocase protein TatA